MKYFPTVGTGRNLQLRFEQMKIASRKGWAEVQRRN